MLAVVMLQADELYMHISAKVMAVVWSMCKDMLSSGQLEWCKPNARKTKTAGQSGGGWKTVAMDEADEDEETAAELRFLASLSGGAVKRGRRASRRAQSSEGDGSEEGTPEPSSPAAAKPASSPGLPRAPGKQRFASLSALAAATGSGGAGGQMVGVQQQHREAAQPGQVAGPVEQPGDPPQLEQPAAAGPSGVSAVQEDQKPDVQLLQRQQRSGRATAHASRAFAQVRPARFSRMILANLLLDQLNT
jgi:hypothetical protein